MKHSRISLLERAAEVYDFASLRAHSPALAPVPTAEPVPTPPIAPLRPVQVAPPAPMPLAAPIVTPRAGPRPSGARRAVDRAALARFGFIDPDAPITGLAEEFRLIKRQLMNSIDRRVSLPEEKRRSLLVASAQPNDGKSFFAVNLALSLAAEREREVLLIDADFNKPEALARLGVDAKVGLVDALADRSVDPETLVIETDIEGFSVLPAGRRATNVPELVASDRTREILKALIEARHDRILIFDTPPALMASPAAVLASHVGQVILVVRADRTTEADLKEAVRLLAGCDHLSLVLNGAALSDSARNFGGYEGYRHED